MSHEDFPECEQLGGRLRAICRGESNLPLATANKYRERWNLSPLPQPDNVQQSTTDHKKKPSGLGDTVAAFTHATGIDRVAKWVAKSLGFSGCGCARRQKRLNELVPYKQ